jgi:hypothetical protein
MSRIYVLVYLIANTQTYLDSDTFTYYIVRMANIQSLLIQLSQSGITDVEIAKNIQAPASIIQRLRTGVHKSTSYERGIKIMDFYTKHQNENCRMKGV